MADKNKTSETIEVPHGKDEHHDAGIPGFLTPDVTLLFTTWVCFLFILIVLSKFAWKPILAIIDAREEHIKKSVEDADKIRVEMETLAERHKQMIEDSEAQAKTIIEDSRKAAKDAAKHITDEAKKESQIILENTQRDMREELKEAQATLREESASIAIELANKILGEHLDESKNRKLISKYIDEL